MCLRCSTPFADHGLCGDRSFETNFKLKVARVLPSQAPVVERLLRLHFLMRQQTLEVRGRLLPNVGVGLVRQKKLGLSATLAH